MINNANPLVSQFLHIDSLVELIKALINVVLELEDEDGDDIEVFKLEILLQIILHNRYDCLTAIYVTRTKYVIMHGYLL